jgi:hypothetical protein
VNFSRHVHQTLASRSHLELLHFEDVLLLGFLRGLVLEPYAAIVIDESMKIQQLPANSNGTGDIGSDVKKRKIFQPDSTVLPVNHCSKQSSVYLKP